MADDLQQGEQVSVNGFPPFSSVSCVRAGAAEGAVTDASGECTLAFSCAFDAPPAVSCTALEAGATLPVIFMVRAWQTNAAGQITGCTVQARRLRTLPASIALLSDLASYDVTEPAADVEFTRLAFRRVT